MIQTGLLLKLCQGHSDPKMVHDTPLSHMHPHTKFGIPTSKSIRDMLQTQYFLKPGQRPRSQ